MKIIYLDSNFDPTDDLSTAVIAKVDDEKEPYHISVANAMITELENAIDEACGEDFARSERLKDFLIELHYGPGAHASGSPQSVHGSGGASGGGEGVVKIRKSVANNIIAEMKNYGATMSVKGKSPAGGFMCGKYTKQPKRQMIVPVSELTVDKILDFVIDNRDDLTLPNHFIGGWVYEGDAYLETSVNIEGMKEAIEAGFDAEQIAIFDWDKKQEIFMDYDSPTRKAYVKDGDTKKYVYP